MLSAQGVSNINYFLANAVDLHGEKTYTATLMKYNL